MRRRVDYQTVTQHLRRAAYVKLPNAPERRGCSVYVREAWQPFQKGAIETHALTDWERVPTATPRARMGAYVEGAASRAAATSGPDGVAVAAVAVAAVAALARPRSRSRGR